MEKNLTTGSVFGNIVRFSLPYLFSYFLQTLYGMADLFIIGQFRGVESTTAVSVGSQVMHMLTVMLVGLVVIQLFPANILGLFEASPDMLAIGVPALRIISLCFVFAGFSIICSSTFQALGNGLLSMMISIVRQLLILLPAAFFLSLSGSVTAVWWAFPIAELASLALCVIFLRRIYRRVILPLE